MVGLYSTFFSLMLKTVGALCFFINNSHVLKH